MTTDLAPYRPIPVTPDSPEWVEERRSSIGASEVPAILGLSPYSTPLDVYNSKLGVDRGMDEELAFIGHAEEFTVGRWLRRFHPEIGVIRRGFMARSTEAPWLHASFDRFAVRRRQWEPVQIKTAHQYAGDEWATQVPFAVQAQVQTEMFVFGAEHGWVVAFVGGRRFELRRVDRDEEFIRDALIPTTRAFWEDHVAAMVPPDPTTSAEAVGLWAGDPDAEITADEDLLGLVRRLVSAKAAAAEVDAAVERITLEIQKRMQQRSILRDPMGTVLATWKPKRGASRIDSKRLRAEHPDLADAYTVRSADSRTFLLKKGSTDEQQ